MKYNIKIICTAHNQNGKCNSLELLSIIEEYNPEIIFEEISKTVFDQCYGLMNRNTLETSAIKMYLPQKEIIHLPVVGAELSDDLTKKVEVLIENSDYRNLLDDFILLENRYGFNFLNSTECSGLFDKMNAIEKLLMIEFNDDIFNSVIQISDANVNKYENEIIRNVYEYSKQNKYDKALLFIGAAHKQSIAQKLKAYDKLENFKLNWSFFKG